VPYTKESKEVAKVIDSLPEPDRQYIREMVFRVAAVARDVKKKRRAARSVLGALSWILISVSALNAAPATTPASLSVSASNEKDYTATHEHTAAGSAGLDSALA
jgi:hypothetical protein